jgi:flagellar FliL protein
MSADNEKVNESETNNTPEDSPPPPPKSKKKMLIIIVAAVGILACVGGAAAFFLKGGSHESEAPQAASEEKKVVYQEMEDIIVNLNSDKKTPSFLKIKIVLEIEDEKNLSIVNESMPKIQNIILFYLRELRPEDMRGSLGLYKLREELLLRLNKAVYPSCIKDVLFKEVLVQ